MAFQNLLPKTVLVFSEAICPLNPNFDASYHFFVELIT